jgi:hypothetical protein
MLPPDEHLRHHHSCGDHRGCRSSTVLNRYCGRASARRRHRGHIEGSALAPPQSSRPTCFIVSNGAVAPQRRPAYHCRYQHATSQRGGGQVNHLGRAPVPSVAHSRSLVVHSRPLTTPHMSSAVRAASLAMVDLQAELKRHCSGEDSYITIEHHWERRRC